MHKHENTNMNIEIGKYKNTHMQEENQGAQSISAPLTFEAPPKCLHHACHHLLHYLLHTHDDDEGGGGDDNVDDDDDDDDGGVDDDDDGNNGSIYHPLCTQIQLNKGTQTNMEMQLCK